MRNPEESLKEVMSNIDSIINLYPMLEDSIINSETEKDYETAINKALNDYDNLLKNLPSDIKQGVESNTESLIRDSIDEDLNEIIFCIKAVNDNLLTVAIDYYALRGNDKYHGFLEKLHYKHPKDDPIADLIKEAGDIDPYSLPSYETKAEETERIPRKYEWDKKLEAFRREHSPCQPLQKDEELEFIELIQAIFNINNKTPTNRFLGFVLRTLNKSSKDKWKDDLFLLCEETQKRLKTLDLPATQYKAGIEKGLSIFDILHASHYKTLGQKTEKFQKKRLKWINVIHCYSDCILDPIGLSDNEINKTHKAMETAFRRLINDNDLKNDPFPVELRNNNVFFNEKELTQWFKRNENHSKIRTLKDVKR